MRTKNVAVLLILFAASVLAFTGCYTQVARPDRDEEPTVAAEPEQEETAEPADEESSTIPHRTNVYIYGGYGYPYYYDPFWWPYDPWRSGIYVRIGYWRDPWSWCGTPWYYSWDCGYYTGWHGWGPAYSYYPHYYGGVYYSNVYRYPVKQRSFDRRGWSINNTPVAYGASTSNSRPSLSKVRPVIYTRSASGTLQRRTRREGVSAVKGSTPVRESVPAVGSGNDSSRRRTKSGESVSGGNSGKASGTSTSGSPPTYTRTRKQAPPASSGGSSSPPVKRSSGGSVSKPSPSGGSGNSGNKGSSQKGSGSSGGSNRRTRP